MIEYFTVDRTVEFLRECIAQGIDTWQANYGAKTRDALQRIREEGKVMNVIPLSTPQVPDLSDERLRFMLERIASGWDGMLDLKPIGVYLYAWTADVLWREGRIDTARDFLKRVRDAGVQVGFGAHIPEAIEYVEEKGWDVDFYMASLYRWAKSREEILAIVPEVPVLRKDPVVAYVPDLFTRPNRLAADVVVDVTDRVDTIVAMLACHRSQVFEWLPYLEGTLGEVPGGEEERLAWLRRWFLKQAGPRADRYRGELIATYGEERGRRVKLAELFEISEYGSPLDAAARWRLFPFVPPVA